MIKPLSNTIQGVVNFTWPMVINIYCYIGII